MVSFWVFDVFFLILFTIWAVWFVRTRKKGVSCEGKLFGIPMVFMYRTQAGVRAINYIGDNFKKTLRFLMYPIIALGYVLMGFMIWFLGVTLKSYITRPELIEITRAPPIAPLIPYFPKIFGLESFFPDFYFAYFIIAIGVVMIVHEFSHGIFMRLFKIKIKSTGLVFFGPLLGAFVEQEEKSFNKKPKLEQMTVLAAGVFANIVTGLVFYGIWILMFTTLFVPAGYQFNSYASMVVPVSMVDSFGEDIGEYSVVPFGQISVMRNLTEVTVNGTKFLTSTSAKKSFEAEEDTSKSNKGLPVYFDAPAIRNQMRGRIIMADDIEIKKQEDLRAYLNSKNPGDSATFKLLQDDEIIEYTISLGASPINSSKPYIGISYNSGKQRSGILSKVFSFISNPSSSASDPATYYEPIIFKDFISFIYLLIWWIILINFLVAIFNMVPASVFDGGRFFYLTILGITGSEKIANKAYGWSGKLLLLWLIAIMAVWAYRII